MILSDKEKAELKANFHSMSLGAKLEYISNYYKWHIILGLILLAILGNTIYREVTRKEPVLYLGIVNVSVGEDLVGSLTEEYLQARDLNPQRNEMLVYSNLYLSEDASTENHEYAYASRMKILASINAKSLDLVLMNREAYDIFSNSDYLLDLSDQADQFASLLMTNTVILSDNSIDYQLNEAEEHIVETKEEANALLLSDLPLFQKAGMDDQVYIGIIANSPRTEEAMRYLDYLTKTK